MKKQLLKEIIEKKEKKIEFAIITDLQNGESCIFEKNKPIDKNFEKYKDKIDLHFSSKKDGIIEGTNIFVETYIRPIKVIIVGAVHIAQYLVNFAKSLNFEISIIDPRGYFATEKRFPNIKIINKWPKEAFQNIETNQNSALIALTHDPKIDDPALQHAIKNNFFYIGALGSKKTHENRCKRLKEAGFKDNEIKRIFGGLAEAKQYLQFNFENLTNKKNYFSKYIFSEPKNLNFDKSIFSKNIDKQVQSLSNVVNIEFIENKNSFSEQDWKELYKLSEETFVEESESLRSKGAGAGLTDND